MYLRASFRIIRNNSNFRAFSSTVTPEFTSDRYNIQRGPYTNISDEHVNFFDGLLGRNRVITDPEECYTYNVDFVKMVMGKSRVVLKPKSTEEVSAILSYCDKNRLAVCPQSGNTGLVGGSVPVFDEIVISMKLMNKIIETDVPAGVLTCEAGCVLEDLENHLATSNLMMPIDLGAKGSCLIGGCVSTNAGGVRLLRYGNLHGSVLGLEAVKANGQVIDSLNTLKKNNTGYHVKHLFIGSEGTLGIVTKVAIQCPPLPRAINTAFLGLDSYDKVLTTFQLAKNELGEILSSYEMMDRASMDISRTAYNMACPITTKSDGHNFYVLLETSGSNTEHDEEKLASFVEKAMAENMIEDGTLTSDPAKVQYMWKLRERVSTGILQEGYVFKYDISLPLPYFYKIVEEVRKRLTDPRVQRISGFGHMGDGNLHLQVSIPEYDEGIANKLNPMVFDYVSKLRGSISAEHGIGFMKTKYLSYSRTSSEIELMHDLKQLMDPNGILNPYKVLYPMKS